MSEIRRNAPCPCGSGKKHKHCCGSFARLAEVHATLERSLRDHEAAEIIRKRQQGFGRGIIHIELPEGGHGVVVGSRRFIYSRDWKYFTDFLLEYLKRTLPKIAPDHPVRRWFALLAARDPMPEGGHRNQGLSGHVASIFYLAYALYLLEHHDRIPPSLLKRLNNPVTFLPAAFEAFVAAAFALAGFGIEAGETKASDQPEGEFRAQSPRTEATYSIEAKRKDRWRHPYAGRITPEFLDELRRWIETRFGKAARKRLKNPIYVFELSIANLRSEEDAQAIQSEIAASLRRLEQTLLIGGERPDPAYVFFTNHDHLVRDASDAAALFWGLDAFDIPAISDRGEVEIEVALERRDQHRDMFDLLKALAEVQRVPVSFDGTPHELETEDGSTVRPLRLGDRREVEGLDGTKVTGVVYDIALGGGNQATVAVDCGGTIGHVLAKVTLTPEEARAARAHGAAVFGKSENAFTTKPGDFASIYERYRKRFATFDREALLKQVGKHPQAEAFASLDLPDLRIRAAREITKRIFAAFSNGRRSSSPV